MTGTGQWRGWLRRYVCAPVLCGLYALGLASGPFHPDAAPHVLWPFGPDPGEPPVRGVRRRGVVPACAWGPLPHHPERIRPDLPLSRLERQLARELRQRR